MDGCQRPPKGRPSQPSWARPAFQQVSWWRRRRVAERLDATPAERGGGDHTDETALRLSVVAALRRLTARQRAVVVLRYYEDLTEAQVAEVLGCSVGTVKRHGHDAVRRLRELVPELLERTPERSER
ncbi:sigma-70 family RNA polymerase sigma factor [Micromonospora aurantiaca]|uniref:Sigma-70 family RNA polymerase sigma factor n=1 Tax=Micromonospora aurantiaca (nom. illeg.) TaxID=47850 RepID=A0ABQ6UA18_9ACTN|nr:sigma-70 family RNA polymerase sigma factor [Micromonospora aurantiaca]